MVDISIVSLLDYIHHYTSTVQQLEPSLQEKRTTGINRVLCVLLIGRCSSCLSIQEEQWCSLEGGLRSYNVISWSMPQQSTIVTWLVVWNMFYFSIQLGMSSSQLTNSIIFQRGWLNHQPVTFPKNASGMMLSTWQGRDANMRRLLSQLSHWTYCGWLRNPAPPWMVESF